MDFETQGVLLHELTHAYQLEPQGIGSYGTNKVFWAFIEGMAVPVHYGKLVVSARTIVPKEGTIWMATVVRGIFSFGCVIIKILIFSVNSTGVRLRGHSLVVRWCYQACVG